ncbi:MAG: IS66 family transposase [Peptococcales bacterium]|jgi:transposase
MNISEAHKIEELKKRCQQLEQENAELTVKMNWLLEQFRLSQHRSFGSSSEKTNLDQQQLFNEVEALAQPLLAEPKIEKITYERRKSQGHREVMLKNLPTETIEYRLSEEEQVCSCCGNLLHEMSTQVRQELKIIPAQVKVINHVRHIYACRNCEKNEINTPIVTAPAPAPLLKGSLVSPSIMAYIISGKYVDGMPLYRQEQQFARLGIELSRQNLANWMIYGANKWLTLLYGRMHFHLLQHGVICADETTLQVLREPGRKAESSSYMWLYRTGREGPPIILYDYQETRGGIHPREFLSGFKGYLQVDGYAGYNQVPDVTLVGCWAHARRKFDEALKALPKNKRSASVVAKEGLEFCNRLFAIERELSKETYDERYKERLARSLPVLDAFLAWLNDQSTKVLPKSSFGQAINYCLNQWDKLVAFLQDGRLEIDNNRSERSIKPFVIGRKNWLFANTPKGARASAIIYSIVETAKENGLNPFIYLLHVFEKLPTIDTQDIDALDDLLPWSAASINSCRMPTK